MDSSDRTNPSLDGNQAITGPFSLIGDNLGVTTAFSLIWMLGAFLYWKLDVPIDQRMLWTLPVVSILLGFRLGYRARASGVRKPFRASVGVGGSLAGLWVFLAALVEYFATDRTVTATIGLFPYFFVPAFILTTVAFLSANFFAFVRQTTWHPRDIVAFLSLMIGLVGLIFGAATYFESEKSPKFGEDPSEGSVQESGNGVPTRNSDMPNESPTAWQEAAAERDEEAPP